MQRAETLTHQLPVGFSADELAVAARWIATRSRSVASLAQIENTLTAVQSILIRARGVPAWSPLRLRPRSSVHPSSEPD